MDREEFKKRIDMLSSHLTYPELDLLHDINEEDADQRAEIERLKARLRTAAQLGIAEIGADGPENAESVVGRLVGRIQQLKTEIARLRDLFGDLKGAP